MTMSKDIKDFIHLYLGCQCQVKYFDIPAQLTGISYDDQQRQWWCYFENTEASYAKIEEVKPILRPLSDMTEEEKIELRLVEQEISTDNILPPIKCGPHINLHLSQRGIVMANWLRKKGFDCDELIESGLSIDKTKLNQ